MVINEAAPAFELASPAAAGRGRFNLDDLRSSGFGSDISRWLADHPRWIFSLLRRFLPIAHVPGTKVVIVTRFDDVQEVLAQERIFHVPYGKKVKDLNGGPNFMLGLQDGDEYVFYRALVMRAFRREDMPAIVTPAAARLSRELLDRCNGRIDAVEGLLTLVSTFICKTYYGLTIPDPIAFGHWAIAMSTDIFVDATTTNPRHQRAAEAGADSMRRLVDASIVTTRNTPGGPDTVLARLIAMQAAGAAGLTDEIIRAILIGMVTGFVPTNTLAAGRILDMLLSRPDFMAQARAAALAGDDDLLRRCLFETLRFRHIHWGLTRTCVQDYTVAAGTPRAKTVKAGEYVLASTWSAMFDGRRIEHPKDFDPDRRPADYMLFGYGLHWCVGAYIAQAQITQAFKALLVKKELRRAKGKDGQLQLLGDFPQHLFLEFAAS